MFNVCYVSSSNKSATSWATLVHTNCVTSPMDSCGDASPLASADQSIAALISDLRPVEIAWFVVFNVVRTAGT